MVVSLLVVDVIHLLLRVESLPLLGHGAIQQTHLVRQRIKLLTLTPSFIIDCAFLEIRPQSDVASACLESSSPGTNRMRVSGSQRPT